MAMYAPEPEQRDFKPVSAGVHPAVFDMFVDLGVQERGEYEGKPLDPAHQIYLRWQIPGERIEFEDKEGNKQNKPAIIGNTFTFSMSEKANLRKLIQALEGRELQGPEIRGYDVTKLVGRACALNIMHKQKGDKTYANIVSIMPPIAGMPIATIEGEAVIYDPDHRDAFDNLRPWLQDKIKAQVIERDAPAPKPAMSHAELDDDLPPF